MLRMNIFWFLKIRGHFNRLKTSLNAQNKPDKITLQSNITNSSYEKCFKHYKYIRNIFSALKPANLREFWNHFRLKEIITSRSQYISHQSFQIKNYEKMENHSLSNILNWPMSAAVFNIGVPVKPFKSFMLDFNEIFKNNGLTFFTIHKNEGSDVKKQIKGKSEDLVKIPNNRLDFQLKGQHHSRLLVALIARLLDTSKAHIKQEISKHPKRLFVPTEQVISTCNYLKEIGYGNEVIQDCPTVLLYPREYVENTLKFVEMQDSNDKSNYTAHTDLQLRLHLCVYYMEKPFHFSGEGVFPSEEAEGM